MAYRREKKSKSHILKSKCTAYNIHILFTQNESYLFLDLFQRQYKLYYDNSANPFNRLLLMEFPKYALHFDRYASDYRKSVVTFTCSIYFRGRDDNIPKSYMQTIVVICT